MWEPESDKDWQKALENMYTKNQKWLDVGLLRKSKGMTRSHEANESWVEDLAEWCVDIDEFGSLIWMASKLSVDRQGQQILV